MVCKGDVRVLCIGLGLSRFMVRISDLGLGLEIIRI